MGLGLEKRGLNGAAKKLLRETLSLGREQGWPLKLSVCVWGGGAQELGCKSALESWALGPASRTPALSPLVPGSQTPIILCLSPGSDPQILDPNGPFPGQVILPAYLGLSPLYCE